MIGTCNTSLAFCSYKKRNLMAERIFPKGVRTRGNVIKFRTEDGKEISEYVEFRKKEDDETLIVFLRDTNRYLTHNPLKDGDKWTYHYAHHEVHRELGRVTIVTD